MSKRSVFSPAIWIMVFVLSALPALAVAAVHTVWVKTYDGPANDFDGALAIAVDQAGNVYVSGYSAQDGWPSTSSDYATVKYDPDGNELWARRYSGPGSEVDRPAAVAADEVGNVYVTGHSWGSGTDYDYATIRYYPNGDTAWVRRYNGPENGEDVAHALAVDHSGNTYVTGYSAGSGTGWDYLTIKYDPFGNEVWTRRYNGPGNSGDAAYAIALDGSGNVYVTGGSTGSGTDGDYLTIKYGQNGEQSCFQRYNGPANRNDKAYAIALDDSGNVYVTGESPGGPGSNYATLKYYPNGNIAWAARYAEGCPSCWSIAFDIAVDDFGCVYVTGHNGVKNYATIKYNADNGDTAWKRIYDGPANDDDRAYSIVVDDSANVYVTGWSTSLTNPLRIAYATIKYDTDGNELWVDRYNGIYSEASDMALDDSGKVYVTGRSMTSETYYYDYATIKYGQGVGGDANADGAIDGADIVYLLNYLYRGGDPPGLYEAGDANCDGSVGPGDVVFLINYLFRDGPPPSC